MDKLITATGLQQFRELLEDRFEIKIKDNSEAFGGMGKETLQKNIQNVSGVNKNILSSSQLPAVKDNTIFTVEYDFDLNGETITIPEDSILNFNGGSIKNGNVVLDNTVFDGNVKFGDDVTFEGTCGNDVFKQSWFENNDVDAFLDFVQNVDSESDALTYEFTKGTYSPTKKVSKETTKDINIIGNNAILEYDFSELQDSGGNYKKPAFKFTTPQTYGEPIVGSRISTPLYPGNKSLTILDNSANLSAGDYIIIKNTHVSSFSPTRNYQQGEFGKIESMLGQNIQLSSPVYGDYSNIAATFDNSAGCVVFKCQFGKTDIKDLSIVVTGNIQKGRKTVGIYTNYKIVNFENITVKGFERGFSISHAINSSITGCNSDTIEGGTGDEYGMVLSNCQNVRVEGGEYKGRNHGIDISTGYGSAAYSETAKNVICGETKINDNTVSRLVYINNAYGKAYKSSGGSGLHTHDGCERCMFTNNVTDGIGAIGKNFTISNNIVRGHIRLDGVGLSSVISNNICDKILFYLDFRRRNSNNAYAVTYDNIEVGKSTDSLNITGNQVNGQIVVQLKQDVYSIIKQYALTGKKGYDQIISVIQSMLNELANNSPVIGIKNIASGSGTDAQKAADILAYMVDSAVNITNGQQDADNCETLYNDILKHINKKLYIDRIKNFIDSGNILVSGNTCEDFKIVNNHNIYIQNSVLNRLISLIKDYVLVNPVEYPEGLIISSDRIFTTINNNEDLYAIIHDTVEYSSDNERATTILVYLIEHDMSDVLTALISYADSQIDAAWSQDGKNSIYEDASVFHDRLSYTEDGSKKTDILDANGSKSTLFRKVSFKGGTLTSKYPNTLTTVIKNNIITKYQSENTFESGIAFTDNNVIAGDSTKSINSGISRDNSHIFIEYDGAETTNDAPVYEDMFIGVYGKSAVNTAITDPNSTRNLYDVAAFGTTAATGYTDSRENLNNFNITASVRRFDNVENNSYKLEEGKVYKLWATQQSCIIFGSNEILSDTTASSNGINALTCNGVQVLEYVDDSINIGQQRLYAYQKILNDLNAIGVELHSVNNNYDEQRTVSGNTWYGFNVTLLEQYRYIYVYTASNSMLSVRSESIEDVKKPVVDAIMVNMKNVGRYQDMSNSGVQTGARYFCTDAKIVRPIVQQVGDTQNNEDEQSAGVDLIYTGQHWVDCFGNRPKLQAYYKVSISDSMPVSNVTDDVTATYDGAMIDTITINKAVNGDTNVGDVYLYLLVPREYPLDYLSYSRTVSNETVEEQLYPTIVERGNCFLYKFVLGVYDSQNNTGYPAGNNTFTFVYKEGVESLDLKGYKYVVVDEVESDSDDSEETEEESED